MNRTVRILAALAGGTAPAVAHAQLGEFHVGVLAGFGTAESYRAGGGVSIAIVPGRLTFLGLRYVYHGGTSQSITEDAQDFDVRTTSSTLAADLGLQFPVGAMELVLGASLGTAKFSQERVAQGSQGTEPEEMVAWEFSVAPSIALYFRTGRFLIAPELQWGLAGDPDFPVQASHRGPQLYLRFVLPFEIDRIRQ